MADRKPRNILFGICGIGTGHTYRQLPLIEHFVGGMRDHVADKLVIFAYGESLAFYRKRYEGARNILVLPVSVPFYVGTRNGLDFAATAALENARVEKVDHLAINMAAQAAAQQFFGRPDLVVSDYEPVAAQYAYAHGAPLVTIDQQSKYLVGDFPEDLDGLFYRDEIARLKMFFPGAHKRIACSFFKVAAKERSEVESGVELCPAILKDAIVDLVAARKVVSGPPQVLVYISSQQDFVQELSEVADICAAQSGAKFHIFLPRNADAAALVRPNVETYKQGDSRFLSVLAGASAIVTTGGHTLLSEAMHLGIPAYVIPLPVYEQAMNAHILDAHGFGMSRHRVDAADLGEFLSRLGDYSAAIEADREVLLRGQGRERVIELLEEILAPGRL